MVTSEISIYKNQKTQIEKNRGDGGCDISCILFCFYLSKKKNLLEDSVPCSSLTMNISSLPSSTRNGSRLHPSGNSTVAVLTIRTTFPVPGVSRMAKKGRSVPSSVYTSMTCLTLLGPCKSSIRAFKGRPSVFSKTCTEATDGAKGIVNTAPPCTVRGVAIFESLSVKFSMPPSLISASTPAAKGYSIEAVLRIAIEFWEPGEATTARNGRKFPSSK
mmetsp:Transcript_24071/g.26843  ORF Transcript_24071/g.26843 Transcript_24071/m.26843 type:complete len:217 (-) Transcript_24071:522-1172(-)